MNKPDRVERMVTKHFEAEFGEPTDIYLSDAKHETVKLMRREQRRVVRVIQKYQKVNDSFTSGRKSSRSCRAGYSLACEDLLSALRTLP